VEGPGRGGEHTQVIVANLFKALRTTFYRNRLIFQEDDKNNVAYLLSGTLYTCIQGVA